MVCSLCIAFVAVPVRTLPAAGITMSSLIKLRLLP